MAASLMRITIWSMLVPYWVGIFSGWFSAHYGKMANNNPDAFIHAALFFITGPAIAELYDWAKKRWTRGGEARGDAAGQSSTPNCPQCGVTEEN